MSDDVKLIITGTFAIATLAWVVLNADKVANLTNALAGNYQTAVKALLPSSSF